MQAVEPNSERCLVFAGPAEHSIFFTTLYEMLATCWH